MDFVPYCALLLLLTHVACFCAVYSCLGLFIDVERHIRICYGLNHGLREYPVGLCI